VKLDLVIVGSGIAGLYAALQAAPHGRVLLASKSALEESNTRYAQGGIAVALAADDSPELHLRDTIAAGDGLCEPDAVGVLTREAPDCIRDLLARGVAFDRDGEDLAWTLEAAHSRPRVLHAGGDATGASIERTLVRAVREAGVAIREHALCTGLLVEHGRVAGIDLLLPGGRSERVTASAVILATGGAGQMFSRTTNPAVATGDGLAIAFRAGAQLADLEFVQFHPTALALDGAPSFLISEAVRGEGGILRDASGHAFMAAEHPDRELAPRDVVARAIHRRMEVTGGPVYLDITHLDRALIERRFPSIVAFCRRWGVDPVTEPIAVSPAAHYLMGGVRTDLFARTSVPGLYACGEVASTGVHGANRLASNSLLEGLVFARRAVHSIVSADMPHSRLAVPEQLRPLDAVDPSLHPDRPKLREVMWRHAGLIRSAGSLAAAAQALHEGTPGRRPDIAGDMVDSVETWETANLALLARLTVAAAAIREESRGGHFRSDFPRSRPEWRGHTILSADGIGMLPLGEPSSAPRASRRASSFGNRVGAPAGE
jgi:L-aspartate oxidase